MQDLKMPLNFQELKLKHPKAKAIIFDMDGTLFNTEYLHAKAHVEIMNQHNPLQSMFTWKTFMDQFKGIDDPTVFKYLQVNHHLDPKWSFDHFQQLKDQYFEDHIKQSPIDDIFRPDLKKLLLDIFNSSLKLALVTSSERLLCDFLLKFFKVDDLFDLTVTRNEVLNYKPHPEPYLKAINILDLHPSEIVVFEDSQVGVKAAEASGAFTYRVLWY